MKHSDDDSSFRFADVGIFGCYPPPYGGIGIHIKRLVPLLEQSGLSVRVYNGVGEFEALPQIVNVRRNRMRWSLSALLSRRHRAYYVCSTRTSVRVWAGLMAMTGHRIILHVDGASLRNAVQSGWLGRALSRFAVRKVWGVVGVNEDIVRVARELGAKRTSMIPAYLHPAEQQVQADNQIKSFLQAHSPALLAMGRLPLADGTDIYGFATLVDHLKRLRERHPRAGLLYALTQPGDLDGPSGPACRRQIEQAGLAEHFVIRPARGELAPLMLSFDLMVRPSITDGDSVALREALYLGLPVIASDCVPRPEGVLVHPTGDSDALLKHVLDVIEAGCPRNPRRSLPDGWQALKNVFAEALEQQLP